MKAEFGTASLVGNCVVFNIGGNKYRLVTRILYPSQKVFILKVMTHEEYDEDTWKEECGCYSPPPGRRPHERLPRGLPSGSEKDGEKMTTKTKFGLKGKSRDSYLELVLAFPLASIKSDEHLEEAQEVMDRLLAKGRLDHGEEMYLDALSDLVAAYEDEHHAIEPASDADMLRHLMEAKGVTQVQLHRDTGIAKSTISEVLAGKKPFSRQMIRKLADYFKVDVSVLAGNL